MAPWNERSREEQALFNPAFCSILLWYASRAYATVSRTGLSFEEAFLILPILLQRRTREALPRDTRTSLAVWINSNPLAQNKIATGARLLAEFTRNAMLFGGTRGLIRLEQGRLLANDDFRRSIHHSLRGSTSEVRHCVRRAELLGRWFAQTGSGSTVLALMGLRP